MSEQQSPPPDAVARRLNGERLVVLGWTRAILLQFAHPLIAAGVYDHSGFRTSPLAAIERLRHTIKAMLAISFGTMAERERAIDIIRGIHRRVNGRLRERVGPFEAGSPYTAEDPSLVLWVHITLIESIVLVYERVVQPLSEAERDEYCVASAEVAVALGADERLVPRSWQALQQRLETFRASGVIVVGGDARRLALAVIRPRGAALAGPAGWVNEVLTIGLLPEPIREAYGFTWGRNRARAFELVITVLRVVRRWLPARAALWRAARVARP